MKTQRSWFSFIAITIMIFIKLILLAEIDSVLFEFVGYVIYTCASVLLAGVFTFGLPFAVLGTGYLLIVCNPGVVAASAALCTGLGLVYNVGFIWDMLLEGYNLGVPIISTFGLCWLTGAINLF